MKIQDSSFDISPMISLLIPSQAYPWFNNLVVEHSENFWSLFGANMDTILKLQPKDNWDSFPLFQIVNDYLRTDGEEK